MVRPALVDVGFHPIDGARFLRSSGGGPPLCALIAHHSAAAVAAELAEWEHEEGPVAAALWTADMTIGPRGEQLAYADRLTELSVGIVRTHRPHEP